MFLAKLIGDSEDLLICDFAQYYHVLDYKELRPSLAATLAVGLPEESRVKKKITGVRATLDELLLALILDNLNLFMWSRSKHKGARPKKIYQLLSKPEKPKDELMSFDTPQAYEEWMARKKEKWRQWQTK